MKIVVSIGGLERYSPNMNIPGPYTNIYQEPERNFVWRPLRTQNWLAARNRRVCLIKVCTWKGSRPHDAIICTSAVGASAISGVFARKYCTGSPCRSRTTRLLQTNYRDGIRIIDQCGSSLGRSKRCHSASVLERVLVYPVGRPDPPRESGKGDSGPFR